MIQNNDSKIQNITLSAHKFHYTEGDRQILSDLYLKVQFPDATTRDKFKEDFLANAKDSGIANPEILIHSRLGAKDIYISPARPDSNNLGVYRSRKGEFAIDFGNDAMRNWFTRQIGITEEHARIPVDANNPIGIMRFNQSVLMPSTDGKSVTINNSPIIVDMQKSILLDDLENAKNIEKTSPLTVTRELSTKLKKLETAIEQGDQTEQSQIISDIKVEKDAKKFTLNKKYEQDGKKYIVWDDPRYEKGDENSQVVYVVDKSTGKLESVKYGAEAQALVIIKPSDKANASFALIENGEVSKQKGLQLEKVPYKTLEDQVKDALQNLRAPVMYQADIAEEKAQPLVWSSKIAEEKSDRIKQSDRIK
ncbi:MAG: hypothetical protein K0R98_1392 [Rickettsiaceae bacterium]|nr:hypothetical protein [Rickettsiaceae bacterium]